MKKLGLLLILAALTGCRGGEENAAVTAEVKEEVPASIIAVKPELIEIDPFASIYRGNLPCSECQGTDVETILQLTSENRYFLTIRKSDNEERHFSGQYRISADKRFIQLDDSADTLTFMLGSNYLEPRLPDGSTGKRQYPNKNYHLERQPPEPVVLPEKEPESAIANA